jgi:hypothetical protein
MSVRILKWRLNINHHLIIAYQLSLDYDREIPGIPRIYRQGMSMKTQEYLDAVKAKLELPSDYALAKRLEVTSSAISAFRVGKAHLGDDTALKVAEILGRDPIEVIAAAHAERAKNPEVQQVWEQLLEKISKGFEVLISCANPRRRLRPA